MERICDNDRTFVVTERRRLMAYSTHVDQKKRKSEEKLNKVVVCGLSMR